MSEMIERVALAMWRKREESFPGFTRRMKPDVIDRSSGVWDLMLVQAHAAIEAMREPSDAMARGAQATGMGLVAPEARKEMFRAMIDAALSNTEAREP